MTEQAAYPSKLLLSTRDAAIRGLECLHAKQVAQLLGVHISTIWRLTQRVESPLPVVRFGERITRFRLTDVEKFIASSAGGHRDSRPV